MRTTRRQALTLASAALLAPTIWTRRARAASPAFGAAKHVLVLNCRGGFRSHCTFNAVGTAQHNPFGTQPAQDGTAWTLGAACGAERYPTSLGLVPSFAESTAGVAVLACVDPNKGGPVEVDHVAGQRRVGTGVPTARTGLLSIVGAHHPLYASGFTASALPPVEIGPSDFGLGEGDYGQRRPLTLFGAAGRLGGLDSAQSGWHSALRAGLDERFLRRRSRAYTRRLVDFHTAKQNAALFLGILQDPRFDVRGAPDATDAGVTNAQLLEVLGDHDMRDIGDPQPAQSWGADVALALRCFAFGAPMVTVTHDGFDMHDLERDAYAPRTKDLVRQLTGLLFLLKRLQHKDGGTYFDHTMVVVTSEFSRNNTFAETGFNSGNGSDHVGQGADPARNMAVAIFGGPVSQGGKMIGSTDDQQRAQGVVFSAADLASTVLDVIGVDPEPHVPGRAIAEVVS